MPAKRWRVTLTREIEIEIIAPADMTEAQVEDLVSRKKHDITDRVDADWSVYGSAAGQMTLEEASGLDGEEFIVNDKRDDFEDAGTSVDWIDGVLADGGEPPPTVVDKDQLPLFADKDPR